MKLKELFFINAHYIVPVLLFMAGTMPLVMAYASEIFLNLHPCVLCLYQRVPMAVVAVLSFLFLALPHHIPLMYIVVLSLAGKLVRRRTRFSPTQGLLLLCGIAFLSGAGIAVFHVGVEQKWWEGTEECAGNDDADTIEQLRAQILGAPLVRCDEPEFYFLGITMAGWNVLYSFAAAFWCFYTVRTLRRWYIQ